MLPLIAAYLIKERDANRQKGAEGMYSAEDFTGMRQELPTPQAGALTNAVVGGMSGGPAGMSGGLAEGISKPAGWSWENAANGAMPGIVTDGKFTPGNYAQHKLGQNKFAPYFKDWRNK